MPGTFRVGHGSEDEAMRAAVKGGVVKVPWEASSTRRCMFGMTGDPHTTVLSDLRHVAPPRPLEMFGSQGN